MDMKSFPSGLFIHCMFGAKLVERKAQEIEANDLIKSCMEMFDAQGGKCLVGYMGCSAMYLEVD